MPSGAEQEITVTRGEEFSFGPFRFFARRRVLQRDGEAIRLGSRALAILATLIEADGELVSKEQLIARVWPAIFVEESNLRVHVAALRKALNDNVTPPLYIATVAGRGYRFAAEVIIKVAPIPLRRPAAILSALVRDTVPIIGRVLETDALFSLLSSHRSVTVTGGGGVGKTSVARNVATLVSVQFPDGVVSVDFSIAASAASAIGDALKISVSMEDPVDSLVAFLKDRELLLLLDSCEHVIDEIAALIEIVLRRAPGVHVLATSTEPLRTEGEWVYRLLEFDIPPEIDSCSATQALVNPAVNLFVERARAKSEAFTFSDADVPLVSEICRRLDGNPLAIEIAAARVDAFGLAELARQLDDRFELLTAGRRTATVRHRTLRNMLDWSYEHLTGPEQALLRRLSVFRGPFGLSGVLAVSDLAQVVLPYLVSLVNKSLVVARTGGTRSSYRLLDSPRAYAAEQATQAGETDHLNQLHALYMEKLLVSAEEQWLHLDRDAWIKEFGPVIDDLRAALDWAFSADGNPGLGIRITSGAIPIAMHGGQIDELRSWMDRAIEVAPQLSPRELAAEVRIHSTFGTLAQNQQTVFGSQARGFQVALSLAELSEDKMLRVGALIAYSAFELGLGTYREALRLAEEAEALVAAHGDDMAALGVNRVLAQATLFSGQNARAHQLATSVISHPASRIQLAYGVVAVNRAVSMRIVTSRALWLMGNPIEAAAVAAEAVELGRLDSPLGHCQALALSAVPIALWSGDDLLARRMTVEMQDEAERFTLAHWSSWSDLFLGVLDLRSGLEVVLKPLGSLQNDTVVTFVPSLVTTEIAERSGHQDGWCEPEIARAAIHFIKHDKVQGALRAALGRAKNSDALGWQLRIATSLAEHLVAADRSAEARAVLEPILGAFREGFETRDLRLAASVLSGL